jgi:hypothetical protein
MIHLTPPDFTTGTEMAIADSSNGFMYIPHVSSESIPQDFMMRLDLASRSYNKLVIADDIRQIAGYAAAWSAALETFLLIGGYRGAANEPTPTTLYLFSHNDQDGWRDQTKDSKSEGPQPRYGACLVPTFGDSKMVRFWWYWSSRLGHHDTSQYSCP